MGRRKKPETILPTSDTPSSSEVIEVYDQELVWEDGQPRAVGRPVVFDTQTPDTVKRLMHAVMNLPYDGEDPRLKGLTKGEAVIMSLVNDAAEGEDSARKEFLDRILGKPMQNIKSLNVKASLEEFLDQMEDPGNPNFSRAAMDEVIDI